MPNAWHSCDEECALVHGSDGGLTPLCRIYNRKHYKIVKPEYFYQVSGDVGNFVTCPRCKKLMQETGSVQEVDHAIKK